MVYQQFINYPALTVYENIASPLRRRRQASKAEIDRRCAKAAALLKLTPYLERSRSSSPAASSSARRSPAPSSRTPTSCCSTSRSPISTTSCARSCATSCRGSSPHRRDLRLRHHRAAEALLLGGNTATLSRGPGDPVRPDARGLPRSRTTSPRRAVFSDPPLNILGVGRTATRSALGARAPETAGAGDSSRGSPTAPTRSASARTTCR